MAQERDNMSSNMDSDELEREGGPYWPDYLLPGTIRQAEESLLNESTISGYRHTKAILIAGKSGHCAWEELKLKLKYIYLWIIIW